MLNFCCQSLKDKFCQTTVLEKINIKYQQVTRRIEALTTQITYSNYFEKINLHFFKGKKSTYKSLIFNNYNERKEIKNKVSKLQILTIFSLNSNNKTKWINFFQKNQVEKIIYQIELEGLYKQSEILKNGLSELTRLEQQKENIITNQIILTEIENRQKQILSLNLRMSVNQILEDQKIIINQLDFLNQTIKNIQSEGDESNTQQHQQNDLNIINVIILFIILRIGDPSKLKQTIQELNEKFQTQESRIRLLGNLDLKQEQILPEMNTKGEQQNLLQEQRNELIENLRSENDNLKLDIESLRQTLNQQTDQINQLQIDILKINLEQVYFQINRLENLSHNDFGNQKKEFNHIFCFTVNKIQSLNIFQLQIKVD